MPGTMDYDFRISSVKMNVSNRSILLVPVRIIIFFVFVYWYPLAGISQNDSVIEVRIDVKKTFQTIENFGASDAWSCQFVGNWPDSSKNKMADWLFSMDTITNGNPKGIGLSLWRFNFGAGSAQQKDASGIKDEWRRAESFLGSDKSYNWQYQQGQLWFLNAAQQRGVKKFAGFFNSPPFQFTRNKKTYAEKGICNIEPAQYSGFANYTVDVIKHIKRSFGIKFNYLSPVNEPQWDWSDKTQEGCPYTNKEIAELIKTFNNAFQKNKLVTHLIIPESGQHNYLIRNDNKPEKGSQLSHFFNDTSSCFVGNLPKIEKVIASHSYFTSSPFTKAITIRNEISKEVNKIPGLRFWQSEYSVLGDNDGEIKGRGRDTGITSALYVAKVIYEDLVAANATAWHWWLAISPYNYKDGLIYIDKTATGGTFYYSKILWALGNYSRFIRPGMQRVDVVTKTTGTDSLLISAYTDVPKKKLVMVIINSGNNAQKLLFSDLSGKFNFFKNQWNAYTTSASQCLTKSVCFLGNAITILPKSIVTLEQAE
jgi:O-glycosyl hydrolase